MKKVYVLALTLLFLVVCTASIYAMPAPIEKLKGGIVSVVKSPLTLGKYTYDGIKGKDLLPIGFFKGFINGSAHMIKEAGKGIVDIATFPVDIKD